MRRRQTEDDLREELEQLQERVRRFTARMDNILDWAELLDTAARMPTESVENILLVHAQIPRITQIASKREWRRRGRTVHDDAVRIRILAPALYISRDPENPAAGKPVLGVRLRTVYDWWDTDGPDVRPPDPADEHQRAQDLWDRLERWVEGYGFRVRRGDCTVLWETAETNATDRTITISPVLMTELAARALAHEAAHLALGHVQPFGAPPCNGIFAVEAESVAVLLLRAAGLWSETYSVQIPVAWVPHDLTVLRQTFERVVRVARAM